MSRRDRYGRPRYRRTPLCWGVNAIMAVIILPPVITGAQGAGSAIALVLLWGAANVTAAVWTALPPTADRDSIARHERFNAEWQRRGGLE
jgi:hypothetical protein